MTEHQTSTVPERANRLARERSPYLLQHAHNPVDWHPWGDEAFRLANEEDKPIFLSIGYSSCHWCHVMAEESFEDEEVASLLNEHFVCVKVDREERPDIDAKYMLAAQLMSGTGGWPLTIFLTPEGRPFFAATYLPKDSRQGMTGLTTVAPLISQFWKERRDEVLEASKKVAEAVRTAGQPTAAGAVGIESLMEGYDGLVKSYDPRHGGFGRAPKFPTPHRLTFLLRYWKRTGEPNALEMVQSTLRQMRRGGIFDQLGGGFHRYSTDRSWTVPHFEKMLYDQALLLMACVEGWQATGEGEFESTARATADYVLDRLTSPEGGFYSAEDADSEGAEGKYYVWSEEELSSFLDPDELSEVRRAFGVTAEGNFDAGGERSNVLRLEGEANELTERVRQKMLERRGRRPAPFLDDKIMADWNGLMIAGLSKAYGAWREPRYRDAARRAATFVLDAMMNEKGRHHVFRDGSAGGPAFLDDHAFMAWGLLELYFADPDPRWLKASLSMAERMLSDYADPQGGFFQTSGGGDVMGRVKEVYDGAIPSGNSVALTILRTLHAVTGRDELMIAADKAEEALSGAVVRSPDAHAQFLNAVDLRLGPMVEITLTGKREEAEPFLAEIGRHFVPHRVVVHASGSEIESLSPLARDRVAAQAAAHVCREMTCMPPARDPSSLGRLLN